MDETKPVDETSNGRTKDSSTESSSVAVMDIKPSAQTTETSQSTAVEPSESTTQAETPVMAEAPVPQNPADGPVDAPPLSPEAEAAAAISPEKPAEPLKVVVPNPVKRSMTKVIVAIVIAVILATAAIYFYTKDNKAKSPNNSGASTATSRQAPSIVAATPARTSDITDTVMTKADATQDVSSTDLSNSTLGL
jgi:cell division protein FtsN